MFGVLQQLEIRRRRRIQSDVAGDRKGFERVMGPIGAEILRHRALDVLHRHGGAPAAE